MKNKKILIGCLAIVIFLIIGTTSYFFYSLGSVQKESAEVLFTIAPGTNKKSIIEDLKKADLIKNKLTTLIYVFFNRDINIQAGTYILNKNMKLTDILEKFQNGDVKLDTVTLTLTSGKNINDLINLINKTFGYDKNTLKSFFEDSQNVVPLIEKYDFLTNDILNDNIYYALEGYLYPDTYIYYENASIMDIITKMLDNTKSKLAALQADINNSSYSIHELITKASIIELEAKTKEDRLKVSQVIDYRLSNKWVGPLGMDVTTYYAVQKDLQAKLTIQDLNYNNPYNTRNSNGTMNNKLPVGPICNPSLESLEAALRPSDTNYAWFVANVCTGEVFFQVTNREFTEKSNELRKICNLN